MVEQKIRSKIYLLIIGILLLTNILLLVFLRQQPTQNFHQDRRAYIAAFLKDEIGFDQQQLQQFDTLSKNHRERMSRIWEKGRGSKGEQFRQLAAGNFTDSVINAVAEQSANKQKAVEVIMCTHLRNIRTLCKPEQLSKFDSLFGKVFNRRGEGKKKN
ncbi:MAG: Spy/CpxP family protein refolding chaperone [Ferruginibacter sp.]